jgi:hypothetical protein
MSDDLQVPAGLDALLTGLDVLSDAELASVGAVVAELQRARAMARGDLDTLIEDGFARGFDRQGHALFPWVDGSVLVCPGSVVERSRESHECTFVHIGEEWVWESGELLIDDVRRSMAGTRATQRSVSLVGVREGLEFDLIRSKKLQGSHSMLSVASYRITGGTIELVSTRAPRVSSHR